MAVVSVKRIELFENIARTGKLGSKNCNMDASSLYKLVARWEDMGLLITEKIGREKNITITPKGKRYLAILSQFRECSDFFK